MGMSERKGSNLSGLKNRQVPIEMATETLCNYIELMNNNELEVNTHINSKVCNKATVEGTGNNGTS